MKRWTVILFFTLMAGITAYAQEMEMSLKGEVRLMATDLDGKTYYPVRDYNDNLCALLKVTLTNRLQNELVLSTGGLAVVKREEKPDGEIWFYVPYQVKNLNFTCMGYSPMPPVSVTLKAGAVYRLTIASDANFVTVMTANVKSNYLKMSISPGDAMISIGETPDYEMATEILSDGNFAKLLNYGTYHYKIEHSLYETLTGTVEVNASNDVVSVRLAPAYNTLKISSFPDNGADVLIDGVHKGTTPYVSDEKFKKGNHTVRLLLRDYKPAEETVELNGDGSAVQCNVSMIPIYATVTCKSDDRNAEIWVDNQFKGTGSWTGRVSSDVTHILEARKDNHQSQSKSFSVSEGEIRTETIGAPVPLYATLNIETDPVMADVTIDGESVGSAPLVRQILMGRHSITVSKAGYESRTQTVDLLHNEDRKVKIPLKKSATSSPYPQYRPTPTITPPTDVAHGKYGKDSAECIKYLSYYKEYFRSRDYDQAYPLWENAFMTCPPAASQTMLIDGTTLLRRNITKASSTEEKQRWRDILMSIHDIREEYYPKYAVSARNNKGLDAISYFRDEPFILYLTLETIIDKNGTETKPAILLFYLDAAETLYHTAQISADELDSAVVRVREIVGSTGPKSSSDSETFGKIKEKLDKYNVGSTAAKRQTPGYGQDSTPFQLVEEKPSFMGGDANTFSSWVNAHLNYPEIAKKKGIQGRVTLSFTIDTDGSVTDVKVLKGVHYALDEEAVRVVSSSPRWTPGTQMGVQIRTTYTFPVIFQLD